MVKKEKMKISAIVLTGGQVDNNLLKKCLDSISWTDEILQINTNNLSGNFSDWRNVGAQKAKGDWLLYIDTDEEVTKDLKEEILEVTKIDIYSGYAIPRRNFFLGHEMKWGGWSPDYVLRLIKKDKLKGWSGEVHEQPKIIGEIKHLKSPLIHRSHRDISDMVEKTNKWSDIEAKLMFDAGHPPMNIFRFFTAGFREFWKRGIVHLGFLDGPVGIIEIFYQTYSRLISYTKLWEMQLKEG